MRSLSPAPALAPLLTPVLALTLAAVPLPGGAKDGAPPPPAACPWADDGALANALARSTWHLTSAQGYRIHGAALEIRREPIAFDLQIGPLLQTGTLDGIPVRVSLLLAAPPDRISVNLGRNSVDIALPGKTGTPCANAGLSMLQATGPTALNRRRATLTLRLWPASAHRMTGLVRVERQDAFGQPDALYHPVEAVIVR